MTPEQQELIAKTEEAMTYLKAQCSRCLGTGKWDNGAHMLLPCDVCEGKGTVKIRRTIKRRWF